MRPDNKRTNPAQGAMTAGGWQSGGWSNPRRWAPALLATLAVANLAAAWFVWQPPGGSVEALESQASETRMQVQRSAANLARLRALVKKVDTARKDQEQFVERYFMDRRTASSSILTELTAAVSRAGLTVREHSFTFEPIEGSDTFSMMTIAANYEGRYSDLRQFILALDRSARFLIIEDVTAVPLQEPGKLSARFKINAFVREASPVPAATASPAASVSGNAGADASLKLAANAAAETRR